MKIKYFKSDNRALTSLLLAVIILFFALVNYSYGYEVAFYFCLFLMGLPFLFRTKYFIKNGLLLRDGVETRYGHPYGLGSIKHKNEYIIKISEITKVRKVKNLFGSKGIEFFMGEYPVLKLYFKKRDEFLTELKKHNSNIEVTN